MTLYTLLDQQSSFSSFLYFASKTYKMTRDYFIIQLKLYTGQE